MKIEISQSLLIDGMIAIYDDYQTYRKNNKIKHPHGMYICKHTPYEELRDYVGIQKAEYALQTLIYMFRNINIDMVVRVSRKWYEKSNWERCLPDEMVGKLIELYTKKADWQEQLNINLITIMEGMKWKNMIF